VPRISQQTIEQVQAASDIVEIVGSYFPLQRQGSEFRALCPFHQEKTPSFYVSPAKQSYYCFGCSAGGSVFQFIQQYEQVDFPESVRRLAGRAGIPILEDELDAEEEAKLQRRKRLLRLHFEAGNWFHRNLLRTRAAEKARAYMKNRGLNIETARNWQIGYAPDSWNALCHWALESGFSREELIESGLAKLSDERNPASKLYDRFRDRLMFPICHESGEVIAFSGRVLQADAKGAKYVNSPESPLFSKGNVLFGLHKSKRALANSRQAILLEGQLDLITAYESGIQNVVAPQGTAFTTRHAALLRRFVDEVVIFFDADRAGEKAADRALELLFSVNLQVRMGSLPAGDDPDSLIRKSGAPAFLERVAEARDFFDLEVERNLAPGAGTAARVAFARKITHFVSFIGEAVVRDTVTLRLAKRLNLPADVVEQLVRTAAKVSQSASRRLTEEVVTPSLRLPRHDIMSLCLITLTQKETLRWLRSQPWQPLLGQIPDSELLVRILNAENDFDSAAGVANFLASLDPPEAAAISHILKLKPIPVEVGRVFWTEFARRELQRRRVQLEGVQRLAAEGSETQRQAATELKEVLDLLSSFNDIPRLPTGHP
jgi:DNA primase